MLIQNSAVRTLLPFFYVVLGIVTTSLAQIFLKTGSSYEILKIKWIVFLSLSLTSYFISFISYYLALRYYDISKISPIMMASTVTIVVAYGLLIAGESFNINKIIGTVLAIGSIILLTRS
jgi:drug/metabolite transporter (DMT)-like permease